MFIPHLVCSVRSQSCLGSGLPPHKVGHLNSKLLLSEVTKKEKNLHKMLEGKKGEELRYQYHCCVIVCHFKYLKKE